LTIGSEILGVDLQSINNIPKKKTKQNKGMKIDNDEYKGWNQKAESVDYTACAH